MIVIWRVLLVIVTAFLGWRIVSYGIGEYYLAQASDQDSLEIDRALAWNPRHPDALFRKALSVRAKDPALASNLLKQSFAEKPSSGYPLLTLAGMAQESGDQDLAAALTEESARRMPANPPIRIAAGGYWASKGNLDAAMTHWSQALEASSETSDTLFPILLKLAEEPRTIGIFRSIAASPPSWWEPFFREAAKHAPNLEMVRTLYAFRRAADSPPLTPVERNVYVGRLRKDGKIAEAYLVWVNGLDATERSHLGLVNNGGFETEPTNSGFDWHIPASDRTTAKTASIAGIEGNKALYLGFRRREEHFGHVYQFLFLDPGTYRVTGIVRTDGLDSKGGLKWVVHCLLPKFGLLGESARFLGSSDWRDFSFEALVPGNCTAQEIRLVSGGKREFEYKMTGSVWFDAISMRKILTQATDDAPPSSNKTVSGNTDGPLIDRMFQVLDVTGARAFSFEPAMIDSLKKTDD